MNLSIALSLAIVLLESISAPLRAGQTAHRFESRPRIKMNYLLYEPTAELAKSTGGIPLLLFLHGGGESGDNIELVKKHGPPKLIAEGREFPFYVLSPQNPHARGFWDDRAVHALLEKIVAENQIDPQRIYLAGMSRGGYGAWRLAMNYPNRFAAMLVICGASAPNHYAERVKHIPIWLVHGAKDRTIPVSETIEMKEALEKSGNNPKLTIYPDAGHDSWTTTFESEEVYNWLLSHKLEEPSGEQ